MTQHAQKWKFKPHPLVFNGHLQTLLGIRWATNAAPYQALQHRITLDDGDQVVLHEDAPANATDTMPIVLLIHGMAGSYLSSYMVRMTDRLLERGYRVFRMDMRGCGAGEGLAKTPPHCGCSEDVAASLYHIAELYPETTTSIVGFSMGGTLTLNMLAEAGNMRIGNLDRSFVISPPLDLLHIEQHFRTFSGRCYNRFFVRRIWPQMLRRWGHYPETELSPAFKQPKRLRDIDEFVVAPAGGFASAKDYYQKTSPGRKLPSIKQPVTILYSEDDPIVPIEPLFESFHSTAIETITTQHGGHLGFLAGRHDDPDFRWLDWRIIEWLAEAKHDSVETKLNGTHHSKKYRHHPNVKFAPNSNSNHTQKTTPLSSTPNAS